jgi:hypothetical protein
VNASAMRRFGAFISMGPPGEHKTLVLGAEPTGGNYVSPWPA